MEKVLVTVEMTNNNYAAYIDALPGCVSTGKTCVELKKHMEESVEIHLEICREYGDEISSVFDTDFELVYKFDAASLLQHYRGSSLMLHWSGFTGINQRQLQRYASGESKQREAQVKKISDALHTIGRELLIVEL